MPVTMEEKIERTLCEMADFRWAKAHAGLAPPPDRELDAMCLFAEGQIGVLASGHERNQESAR